MKEALVNGLSKVYEWASQSKNFFYDAGLADSIKLNCSVISIGNLTVGGTGKTPVTDLLLKEAMALGIKAAVVSRNYKASSTISQRVDPSDVRGAEYFGDEPFMLAKRNPEAGVFTGPQKWFTALRAQKEFEPQLVIIDDGFQHRALARDFDIVLLDATVPMKDYELLPKGRGREGFESLTRAKLVIITKVNWAEEAHVNNLKTRIPKNVEVAEMDFSMELSEPISMNTKVLAVSGVANPTSFRQELGSLGEFEVVDHLVFPDHHKYNEQDINTILEVAKATGCHKIVTTAKDMVKLLRFERVFRDINVDLVTVDLKVQWRNLPKGLNEYLDKVAGI